MEPSDNKFGQSLIPIIILAIVLSLAFISESQMSKPEKIKSDSRDTEYTQVTQDFPI